MASILYATDFSPEAASALPYARSLAREFRASLILLHALGEPRAGEFVHPPELMQACFDLLRQLVPNREALPQVPEVLVERGSAPERILEVARRKRAQLIVLGVRRPLDFPGATEHLPAGTAHKVVAQAMCPVLTIRA